MEISGQDGVWSQELGRAAGGGQALGEGGLTAALGEGGVTAVLGEGGVTAVQTDLVVTAGQW